VEVCQHLCAVDGNVEPAFSCFGPVSLSGMQTHFVRCTRYEPVERVGEVTVTFRLIDRQRRGVGHTRCIDGTTIDRPDSPSRDIGWVCHELPHGAATRLYSYCERAQRCRFFA